MNAATSMNPPPPFLPPPLSGMPETGVRIPPVISSVAVSKRGRLRAGHVILCVVLCLPLVCAVGVAGYFRLSYPTSALRTGLMESVPGQWDKRFAVHVGPLTLGLVRFGSQFFTLPPEPKAALGALHAAEVGVYKLEGTLSALDYSAMFVAADNAMKRCGWERIVGVAKGTQFVAVYMPRNVRTLKRMGCSVVVLNERDLVVAGARGNLEPLLDLARSKLQEHNPDFFKSELRHFGE